MGMELNKFTDWVRKNAEVRSDGTYATVCVTFPRCILTWFDSKKLMLFVAELYPGHNWLSIEALSSEENSDEIEVCLWWWKDREEDLYGDKCPVEEAAA